MQRDVGRVLHVGRPVARLVRRVAGQHPEYAGAGAPLAAWPAARAADAAALQAGRGAAAFKHKPRRVLQGLGDGEGGCGGGRATFRPQVLRQAVGVVAGNVLVVATAVVDVVVVVTLGGLRRLCVLDRVKPDRAK